MERSGIASQICRFGLFEVDLTQGTLTRQGAPVKLQEQPFLVLAMLLEHPGEIVTREDLRHKLWPQGTFVDFDGSLNAVLKRLRAALNDDPDQPRFIETVPKRGYRFIAPVTKEMAEKSANHTSATFTSFPSENGAQTLPHGILSQIASGKSARRIAILFGIFLVA